jgi:hypothetical protein
MKIVFTYSCYENSPQYIDNNIIKVSLELIKNLGYQTIIYVDDVSLNFIKKFKFDDIRVINSKIYKDLPNNIWSLSKLVTFSKIDEPFCHIDFDIFIKKDPFIKFVNCELFSFHKEGWRPMPHFEPFYSKAVLDLDISMIPNMTTYNCALIGSYNNKQINDSAQIVLEYLKKEKQYFYTRMDQLLKNGNHWLLPVFVEQILFMNISKYKLNLEDIEVLFKPEGQNHLSADYVYDNMEKHQVYHLWGDKKEFMHMIANKLIKS